MRVKLAGALFCVAAACCQAQTLKQGTLPSVLAAERARVEATDVRAQGRLVQVAGDGTRKSTPISIKARWFADGLHMMVEAGATRFTLVEDAAGHTSIELVREGADAKAITAAQRAEGVLGSGFAYEDLAEGQFLWRKQTLLPAVRYGERNCFVLRSEPGPGEQSAYASVTTWIDQQTGAPIHVERTLRGNGGTKQFVFYDLRQTDGLWAARQVEVKLEGHVGSSLLILERGSARAHLIRKDFGAP